MPKAAPLDRLTYRQREVAEKLGLSHQSIRRLIQDGELDTVRIPGRRAVLITAASLARFLEDNARTAS